MALSELKTYYMYIQSYIVYQKEFEKYFCFVQILFVKGLFFAMSARLKLTLHTNIQHVTKLFEMAILKSRTIYILELML